MNETEFKFVDLRPKQLWVNYVDDKINKLISTTDKRSFYTKITKCFVTRNTISRVLIQLTIN